MVFSFLFLANKDKLILDFFIEENLDVSDLQESKLYKNMQKDTSKQDTSKSDGKIARIFTVIQANLTSELVNKTSAIFQFNVKGSI